MQRQRGNKMFFDFIMKYQVYDNLKNKVKSLVEHTLNKSKVSYNVKEVNNHANRIVAEAQINKQKEMIERTLEKRELEIEEEKEKHKEVDHAKVIFSRKIYLARKNMSSRNEKSKGNANVHKK
jgi:hypothetical protein